MEKVKIGFLPLYVKLYDDFAKSMRPGIDAYCDELCAALEKTGVELVKSDICRIAPEFEAAVDVFEKEEVDAIVTVHMAYSPSLECIDALANTRLPILVMDTTRDFDCGFDMVEGAVSYCHGIHGVQDMCNLLRRRGKDYTLFAGHFTEMFCPDWKGNSIYMSHMGESNLKLLENKKTVIKSFPYTDASDPTCILGHMVAGKACVFNLLPNAEGRFDVVICEGEMLQLPETIKTRSTAMNGWFKPKGELADFLEAYSELGGTHHSALVYGVSAKSLSLFAKTLGMKVTVM